MSFSQKKTRDIEKNTYDGKSQAYIASEDELRYEDQKNTTRKPAKLINQKIIHQEPAIQRPTLQKPANQNPVIQKPATQKSVLQRPIQKTARSVQEYVNQGPINVSVVKRPLTTNPTPARNPNNADRSVRKGPYSTTSVRKSNVDDSVDRRSTSFQKKTPAKRFNPIKKYLYFTERCDFCVELIRMLAKVPKLGERVECISVDEYDVRGINGVPAIDDGESENPFELEQAFVWLIDQCSLIYLEDDMLVSQKKMKPQNAIRKSTITEIEISINKIFAKVRHKTQGILNAGAISRDNKSVPNPMERFRTLGGQENLASANYDMITRTKDEFEKIEPRYGKMNAMLVEEKIRNQEKSREAMWEQATREWIRRGIIDPHTMEPLNERPPIKRESLKSRVTYSEADMRRFSTEREAMLNELTRRTGGNVNLKKPMTRESVKVRFVLLYFSTDNDLFQMGMAVSERELAAFEAQRSRMIQDLEAKVGRQRRH